MNEKITTKTGKAIELPARLYNKRELKKREIPYVNDKIFFNRTIFGEKIQKVSQEIRENMAVLYYLDISKREFKSVTDYLKVLREIVEKQKQENSDFIIFPASKNERDFLLRKKFALAAEMSADISQDIIVEIHYKSEIPPQQLAQLSKPINFLSIFFNIPYGHYNCFKKLVRRVCYFKATTGKKVLCMGVPIKFSGDNFSEVHFMPIFDIVADMWVKSWRGGGGPREIKVVDNDDYQSKNHLGWLNSGYKDTDLLINVNHTVAELFTPENEKIREEFENYLLDEAIRDIAHLNPLTIDGFLGKKFDEKYVRLISTAYREKLIDRMFRKSKAFLVYNEEERNLLEKRIRENHFDPLAVAIIITRMKVTITEKRNPPVKELIKEMDRIDFDL